MSRDFFHVCPPHGLDVAMNDLQGMLHKVARGNVAPIPIATALEDNEWTCDVSVHLPGVIEYDVTGTGPTLEAAVDAAKEQLRHSGRVAGTARRECIAFGITP